MSAPPVVAAPDATIEEVVSLMLTARVGAVIIADTEDLAGIVTRNDLQLATRAVPLSGSHVRAPSLLDRFVTDEDQLLRAAAEARARPVREVMTTPVLTLPPDASLWDAADLFLANGIGHAPIVEAGRVVGMVSRLDLLRLVADPAARVRDAGGT
jgi:CBS domain-containing protein